VAERMRSSSRGRNNNARIDVGNGGGAPNVPMISPPYETRVVGGANDGQGGSGGGNGGSYF
jgi:hypothetical protein